MESIRGFFRSSLVIIQVPLDFPLRSQVLISGSFEKWDPFAGIIMFFFRRNI